MRGQSNWIFLNQKSIRSLDRCSTVIQFDTLSAVKLRDHYRTKAWETHCVTTPEGGVDAGTARRGVGLLGRFHRAGRAWRQCSVCQRIGANRQSYEGFYQGAFQFLGHELLR